MKLVRTIVAGMALLALADTSSLARDPIVGGVPMSAKKNIVQNASSSKEHTILVKALKAAGLTDSLSGPGPFTVFAPTDAAFRKLPPGTVDNLLRPENKAQLQSVLTYHIVQGEALTARELLEKIKEGGGKAQIKTVQGETLTVEKKGRSIGVIDAKGDNALVTIPNVTQSNGVIHVINTVLLP